MTRIEVAVTQHSGKFGKSPYLLLKHTVEDKDEHPLQGVEDGEQVGHDHCALVDIHQAKGPRQAQQTEQGNGPDHP